MVFCSANNCFRSRKRQTRLERDRDHQIRTCHQKWGTGRQELKPSILKLTASKRCKSLRGGGGCNSLSDRREESIKMLAFTFGCSRLITVVVALVYYQAQSIARTAQALEIRWNSSLSLHVSTLTVSSSGTHVVIQYKLTQVIFRDCKYFKN
jgi:hypothetical protein